MDLFWTRVRFSPPPPLYCRVVINMEKNVELMFDPNSLVGKELRSLDDTEYGHRVLDYNSDTQKYIVETIYWNSKELVNPDYLGSTIGKDTLYKKYDVKSLVG